MIALIDITITQSEITNEAYLYELAKVVFPHEPSSDQDQIAKGIEYYLSRMANAEVKAYICFLNPSAQAAFLWLNAREIQVVVETFHHGHLLRSVESVISAFGRRLRQIDMQPQINVKLQAHGDAQTYIMGKPSLLRANLWDRLRNNLVAIGVGIIIAFIAKMWLPSFYHEAIAGLISLVLFSCWEAYLIWEKTNKQIVNWSVYD